MGNEELIAHCGLYCRDCLNYKGEIADLARDLRKKLREAKFDQVSQMKVIDLVDQHKTIYFQKAFLEWGISDALFIDGRQIRTGPPPSYAKIRSAILKKAKKLR